MKEKFFVMLMICLLAMTSGHAQLSSNPNKFLGNITTVGQIDYGKEKFYQLWNQITGENESKWASIEGSARGQFYWNSCDNLYNYAKQHNFPFKFHTLIWGGQFPGWIKNLSAEDRYEAIVEWMDAVKQRYPDLQLIDVVNEAIDGHQADTPYLKEALGGAGKTGYDWIIKAFEMAYERWPNAILIYNDYNSIRFNIDQYIDLVRTLRNAGAPIDAYGLQAHELTDCSESEYQTNLTKLQTALKMPMYLTEYDIATTDDALQKQRYMEQIPYAWEKDYCAGITLWGYIYGKTWSNDGAGYSGIIKDGKDRPAMEWLRTYMSSDKAKNAKSPFPGMKKEASIYLRPATMSATKGQPTSVEIRTHMRSKTIDHIDFYVNNVKKQTLTEAPYIAEFTPTTKGNQNMKAVLVTTDGSEYTRQSYIIAYNARTPYQNTAATLPGTIQAENFDNGDEGQAYHDSDTSNSGTSYRTGTGGVDYVTGGSGYAIGYTNIGEWMEYTVDVTEGGVYAYEAYVASGTTGSAFTIGLKDNDDIKNLCTVSIPQTDSGMWNTYKWVKGRLSLPLEAGRHILRVTITGTSANIDKIVFKRVDAKADPNFHIYLCFGQSNMEGNAQWETIDNQYVDPRFQMLATTNFDSPARTLGNWYTAECPIVSPVGKLGMADYFGRTMVAAMPQDVKVGVIAVAMGGSPIEMFDKDKYKQKLADEPDAWWATLSKNHYGGNPYGRLIDMARQAQQDGVIKGILLHQGCSNCGDPNWPGMVKKIYNDILADLGLRAEDVPLFAGETEREDMGGGCSSHNTQVNRLPEVIPTAHVVSSENIPGNGKDAWHFSAAGYRIFGMRYALEALKTMGRELHKDADYTLPDNLKPLYTLSSFDASPCQVKVGSSQKVTMKGTFADGRKEDITDFITLTSDDFTIVDNAIQATEEKTGIVTVHYTDFAGIEHTTDLTVEAVTLGILERYETVAKAKSSPFAILNEEEGKAFYTSGTQDLGFADYGTAFAPNVTGYYFKLISQINNSDPEVKPCCLIRAYKLDGKAYSIGSSPAYLNGYSKNGTNSFVQTIGSQFGYDTKYAALWMVDYVEGKGFTLCNKVTGKYLSSNATANSDEPVYLTFCTIGEKSTAISPAPSAQRRISSDVYSLQGLKVDTIAQWSTLPRGIYIINGKKTIKQ